MRLNYNYKDLLLAPKLALSGRKIFIFSLNNFIGFSLYWFITNLSLYISGINFSKSFKLHGLYPHLIGHELNVFSYVIYFIGLVLVYLFFSIGSMIISKLTIEDLRGNTPLSIVNSIFYVSKHYSKIIITPLIISLIILFFLSISMLFIYMSNIPFLGGFLFPFFYFISFLSIIFVFYSFFVLINSLHLSPTIIGTQEEDSIGVIYQIYSITWGGTLKLILYYIIILPIAIISVSILSWILNSSYSVLNYFLISDLLSNQSLVNVFYFAGNLINIEMLFKPELHDIIAMAIQDFSSTYNNILYYSYTFLELIIKLLVYNIPKVPIMDINIIDLNMFEMISGYTLAFIFFIIMLIVISYASCIFSVGNTLINVIFKYKFEDYDLAINDDNLNQKNYNAD